MLISRWYSFIDASVPDEAWERVFAGLDIVVVANLNDSAFRLWEVVRIIWRRVIDALSAVLRCVSLNLIILGFMRAFFRLHIGFEGKGIRCSCRLPDLRVAWYHPNDRCSSKPIAWLHLVLVGQCVPCGIINFFFVWSVNHINFSVLMSRKRVTLQKLRRSSGKGVLTPWYHCSSQTPRQTAACRYLLRSVGTTNSAELLELGFHWQSSKVAKMSGVIRWKRGSALTLFNLLTFPLAILPMVK